MKDTPDTVTLTFSSGAGAGLPISADVPRLLGHVRLIEEVGQGAMGVVWRGRDEFLHRPVAIKLLRRGTVSDSAARLQFVEGARAAAAIKHDNVVSVYHADEYEELVFIVMEFVEGRTLRWVMDTRGTLEEVLAALITGQTLEALASIHAAQVIHRDLKPSNVMFDGQGALKVSDFGLSFQQRERLDDCTSLGGTPAYMAPEMFDGEASFQSDIYAMGVMLFEMLCGQRPFRADSVEGFRVRHRDDPFPIQHLEEKGVAGELVEIVQRAVNKKKIFRYKSAAHMLQAVSAVSAGGPRSEVLARRVQDLVRAAPGARPQEDREEPASDPPSPATTTFDMLSRRAAEKRRRRGR